MARRNSSRGGSGSPKTRGRDRDRDRDRGGRGGPDRKTLQLCKQVQQTLEYVLTGESGDDTLRGLYVAAVDPAPDASRLLVTVTPQDRTAAFDAAAVLEKLAYAQPRLRSEVAGAISRRKVPDLTFTYASPDDLYRDLEPAGDTPRLDPGELRADGAAGDGAPGEEE